MRREFIKIHDLEAETVIIWQIFHINGKIIDDDDTFNAFLRHGIESAIQMQDIITIGKTIFEPINE